MLKFSFFLFFGNHLPLTCTPFTIPTGTNLSPSDIKVLGKDTRFISITVNENQESTPAPSFNYNDMNKVTKT